MIRNVTLKYYPHNSIASVNFANSRAIITIQNEPENKELADKLKDELSNFENIKKVNVIYTANKAQPTLQDAPDIWKVKNVKNN